MSLGTDWELVSSCAGLLALAASIIYSGSYGSLPSKPNLSREKGKGAEDEEDSDDEEELERVSVEDAWIFPVFGSFALYGLYLVIHYYGSEWINFLLKWYFVVTGVGSAWATLRSLVRFTVGKTRWQSFERYSLKYTKGKSEVLGRISWRAPTGYLFPLAVLPSFLYAVSDSPKSALLTDILAVSFAFNAIALVQVDSFLTGSVVLGGLFVYDIWWVFGTEVMVKVATKLDAPIKLLWPKSVWSDRGFTMLGLGDVVVPGIFVALALRYDVYQERNGMGPRRVFFRASLTGYCLGLFTTMAVMHVFRAAQPALLYISPACILSVLITGVMRGELREMWEWVDGGRQASGVVDEKKTE